MGEPIAAYGEEAGICGEYDGAWEPIAAASDGRVVVAAGTAASPLNAATAANQAIIITSLINAATTPHIYNLYMTLADTEYEQALPAGTKKFMVRCRGNYDIILRFEEAGNGAVYLTVPKKQAYWEDGLNLTGKSLWLVCATAAQTAEIVAWT